MKIIAVSTSLRAGGNGDAAVHAAAEAARAQGAEVEELFFRDLKNIQFCRGCGGCKQEWGKGCVIDDDVTPLVNKFYSADGYILCGPIYMTGFAAQFKLLFDRCAGLTRKMDRSAMPNRPAPGAPGTNQPGPGAPGMAAAKASSAPAGPMETKTARVHNGTVNSQYEGTPKRFVLISTCNSLRDDKDIPRAETMAFQFKDVGVKEWRMVCVPGCHPFDGGGKTEENQAICAQAGAWAAGA